MYSKYIVMQSQGRNIWRGLLLERDISFLNVISTRPRAVPFAVRSLAEEGREGECGSRQVHGACAAPASERGSRSCMEHILGESLAPQVR